MIAARAVDVRANMKGYMDMAYNGEPVIVSRRQNRNVVIVSEQEYNDLHYKPSKNAISAIPQKCWMYMGNRPEKIHSVY